MKVRWAPLHYINRKINGQIKKFHNTDCNLSFICVSVPSTSVAVYHIIEEREETEGEKIKMERRGRELTRMIVFFQSTVSALATRGMMFDSSLETKNHK